MQVFKKRCKKCGRENPTSSDICFCGNDLILTIPVDIGRPKVESNNISIEIETNIRSKKYKRCKVCNTKNYYEHEADLIVCKYCGDDQIGFGIEKYDVKMTLVSDQVGQVVIEGERRICLGRLGEEQYQEMFENYIGVSRRHCDIYFSNNNWILQRRDTSNGTYVNGIALGENEETVITKEAVIKLGTQIEFKVEEIEYVC